MTLFIFSQNFHTNFPQRFLSNYLSQMLEIFIQCLLRHAISWDIFLYQSNVIFLFNEYFVYFSQNFQTNFRQRFLSSYLSQMLEILTHYLFRHAILWDIFLYQSDASFLLNVDFAYFAYSHQSGGITSKHWLTDLDSKSKFISHVPYFTNT